MVDCSHGNSLKDHRRQPEVVAAVAEQVSSGSHHILGLMFESHLVEGRQTMSPGCRPSTGRALPTRVCRLVRPSRCWSKSRQRSVNARGPLVDSHAMYEAFYGLKERPFELVPNPRFLFLTARQREALSNLRYGLTTARGLTLMIGEAGRARRR